MDFPGFQPFATADPELYRAYQEKSRTEVADACYNSRYAWNVGYNYSWRIIADCFCLISDGGLFTDPHLALPLGDLTVDRLQQVVDTLMPEFAKRNYPFRVKFVDEDYVPLFESLQGYTVESRYIRDYSDYLYDGDDLRELRGRSFRAKRNHINQFYRVYPDFTFAPVQHADQEDALELVRMWCEEKHIDCQDPTESDYKPIQILFEALDELQVKGGTIRVGGRLVAFSLGSLVYGDTLAVIHFEKADPEYGGLYAAINQLTMQEVFPTALLVNREEDMGIEGMRIAKESYNPVRLLHKYQATLYPVGAAE